MIRCRQNFSGLKLPHGTSRESRFQLILILLSSAATIEPRPSLSTVIMASSLECLHRTKIKRHCKIYAYVLMTNYFYLLVQPAEVSTTMIYTHVLNRN